MTKRVLMPAVLLAALALPAGQAAAQNVPAQDTDLAAIFAAPVAISRDGPVTAVPLELRMDKLFVHAAANGESREFIFDTGSPTILTREFADALGLETIGRNTGVDANGNPVTMEVAVLDRLAIGGTAFHRVPVLIFDFSALPMGRCFIDGGILGSEILPGSAWRIDVGAGRLSIAGDAATLGGGEPELQARLYDFGYPHAPIVDYGVGDLQDKALFDTGNAEQVTLFARAADSAPVREHVVPGSVSRGEGYEGESAGGRGETGPLVRFSLEDFRIGDHALDTVRATTRSVPPSLLGAGMLASYTITLDYPGEAVVLERRDGVSPPAPEAGYAIAFSEDYAEVAQLFADSPAAAASLRLGDRVLEVQGRSLDIADAQARCEAARWLTESFEPAEGAEIVVLRESEPVAIHVPSVSLPD